MSELGFHQLNQKPALLSYLITSLIGSQDKSHMVILLSRLISELQVFGLISIIILSFFGGYSDFLVNFLNSLSEVLSIEMQPLLTDENTLIILWTIGIYLLLLLVLEICIITLYLVKSQVPRSLRIIWNNWIIIHHEVIFLIIHRITVTHLSQNEKTSSAEISLLPFYSILNALHGLVGSALSFDPFSLNQLLATRSSTLSILTLSYKIVAVPLLLIDNPSAANWTQILIAILFIAMRLAHLVVKLPFHSHQSSKLHFAIYLAQLIISILSLLAIFVDKADVAYLYFMLLMIPISIKLAHHYFDSIMKQTINLKSTKSTNDFFKKLLFTTIVMEKGCVSAQVVKHSRETHYELYYLSLLKNHSKACVSKGCPCYLMIKSAANTGSIMLDKSDYTEKMNQIYLEIMKNKYSQAIKRIRNNAEIKISYANFLYRNNTEDYLSPMILLNSPEVKKSNVIMRTIALKLIEEIENQVRMNYCNEIQFVNTKSFYDYDSIKNSFHDLIKKNTERYISFWEQYQASNSKMKDLFTLAETINKSSIEVTILWKKMESVHSCHMSDSVDYSLYMSLVGNAPYTSRKVIKYQMKKKNENNFQTEYITPRNVDQNKDAFLYISLSNHKIIHDAFLDKLLGYAPQELQNQSISMILPPHLRKSYDMFVQDPHSYNPLARMHKTHFGCGMTKQGFLAPVSCYFAPLPYMKSDMTILSIIRPIITNDHYMILNKEGEIQGISEDIANMLNLNLKDTLLKNINVFCRNGEKVIDKISSFSNKYNEEYRSLISKAEFVKKHSTKEHKRISTLSEGMQNPSVATIELNPDKSHNHIDESDIILEFYRNEEKTKRSQKVYSFKTTIIEKEESSGYTLILEKLNKVIEQEIKNLDDTEDVFENIDENLASIGGLSPVKKRNSYHFSTTVQKSTTQNEQLVKSNKFKRQPSKSSEEKFSSILNEEEEVDLKRLYTQKLEVIKVRRNETKHVRKQEAKILLGRRSSKTSMSSYTEQEGRDKKLEQAIYSEQTYFPLKILNFSVIAHMILCIILLIGYLSFSNSKINEIASFSDLIINHRSKIYHIFDNYWNGWLWAGIPDRIYTGFGMTGDEYYHWCMSFFPVDGLGLSEFNHAVWQNISKLDPHLQEKLNRPLKVFDAYNNNEIRYASGFDLTNELSVAAMKVWGEYSENGNIIPDGSQDKFEFIRKNSANDLLVHFEETFDLIYEQVQLIFEEIDGLIIAEIVIIVTISLILYIATIYLEIKYIKKKDLFIEAFLRVQDDQVDEILESAKRLKMMINDKNDDYLQPNSSHRLSIVHKGKTRIGSTDITNFKTKAISLVGINSKSYWFLGFLLLFQAAIAGVCFGIAALAQFAEDNTQLQFERLVKTNHILYKFSTAFLAMYEYIMTDGNSLLRGNPIGSELENDVQTISDSFPFFFSLRDGIDANSTAQLDYLLEGNLCETIFVNDDCILGVPEQGVLSINSFIIRSIKTLRDHYDESNHTREAQIEALNLQTMRDLEMVFFYTGMIGNEQIQSVLLDNVFNALDKVKSETLLVVVFFSIAFVLFTAFIWYPIWKNFRYGRRALNKMLRVIPVNIIMRNGYLKAYFISHSRELQASIKTLL